MPNTALALKAVHTSLLVNGLNDVLTLKPCQINRLHGQV
jgi:hypothetical protein